MTAPVQKVSAPCRVPRLRRALSTTIAVVAAAAVCSSLPACGASTPAPAATVQNPSLAIDADPLAVLPAGVIALGSLDARAFYASGSTGAELAGLAESAVPVGQEVGFALSRDVDRVIVGVYASGGVDVVTMLSGRFDAGKMQAAAGAHATSRTGAPWVALPYAGRTLFTSSNVAFAPLTDHTMAAGSESAVRRVLDRLGQGGPGAAPHLARELPDWMLKTVESPGSSYGFAADVAAIPPAVLHGLPLPAVMSGLSRLALIGDFHPPGLNLASTLSYTDASRAAAGADSLKQVGSLITVASKFGAGPQLQNLAIAADGVNVGCKFALDDEAMRRSLASVVKLLGPATGRPPG